ncbi:benzyl alcohol dehydrogenase [Klebsiella pneumoniae subsp. ozaenae]|uniref:Benzyl alcohol dehydrogenase n=1 Tax=Klebsiella pneumoniae subsp. ozaenae TaxID=574 RepID=A0A377ZN03_KLEPO|nr:benzyl alcohol dehydrogenase [Klebsiella pneumoniae subsp. ozaenae]
MAAARLGLSAIMAAKLTGCSQIIAVDIHASRLALAGELGATHQINGKEQDAVAVIKQITGKGATTRWKRPASPLSFCRPYTR